MRENPYIDTNFGQLWTEDSTLFQHFSHLPQSIRNEESIKARTWEVQTVISHLQ